MWRWYWRISLGVLAVYVFVGGFAALVGGDWWEMGLAALWWLEFVVAVGVLLGLITSGRRLLKHG